MIQDFTWGFQYRARSLFRVEQQNIISLSASTSFDNIDDLCLTPKLIKFAEGLKGVTDDRLRYQQLLYLADKCKSMPTELKVESNKVPGCLSTVYVHATLQTDGKVYFAGDSDAMLTKGLVAILVDGLSGHTPEEIQLVKAEFVQYAGISKSLTPGRNNGFLNMLQLMKVKAKNFMESSQTSSNSFAAESSEASTSGGRVIYDSIVKKLSMLQPVELVVEDESYKHAGHAGTQGLASSETHFNVRVIASCFDGLSLVQRHKMIYTVLTNEMSNGIHALSIYAKTPTEEANKANK